MLTEWRTVERLRGADGTLDAEIQSRGEDVRRHTVGTDTEWTMSRLGALRRIGRLSVLDHPFAEMRIVARSPGARGWLGRCTGCARAHSANEHAMVSAAAAHGLLVACADGLAPSAHDEPAGQGLWTYPEAAHWASIALDRDNATAPAGLTREGMRHRALPGLVADDERDCAGEIVLAASTGLARAIAPSAQRFAPEALKAEALSRWLARFAQIRELRTMTDADEDYQLVRRGMPEGGAFAALRLWPAVERVDGIAPALYRYNALRHTLSAVSRKSRIFIDRTEQATERLFGRPAGALVLSARMNRLTAKYSRTGLALALQNAGACIAAATAAGAHEGIAVRGIGIAPGEEWLEATGKHPSEECPLAMIAFGAEGAPTDEERPDDAGAT